MALGLFDSAFLKVDVQRGKLIALLLDELDRRRLIAAAVPPKQARKALQRAHDRREFWRVTWPEYLQETQRIIVSILNSSPRLLDFIDREPAPREYIVPRGFRGYQQRDGYRVRVRP